MELDDAYANGAYIEGASDFPPRWNTEAAAFRANLGSRAELDLPYAEGARNRLDIFYPEGSAKGLFIFVHGGYWRAFDKSTWSHFAEGALKRGWAVAMPSYDLCPDVRISDITHQIARAVEMAATKVEGPIALAGHSAGGHLVARMLEPGLLSDPVASRIRTVLPISPLSDLRPLLKTSMNEDLRLTEEEAALESPIQMTRRHQARVETWVGGAERPSFLDQAQSLSVAWGIECVVVPKKHHFDVIDALCDPESDMVAAITG